MLEAQKKEKIKCVIWDLDNTLWEGILLENDEINLKNSIVDAVKIFDQRGILNSIASRNNYKVAQEKLKDYHLWEYFVCPEINWDNKSESISRIVEHLNIGIETFAFIDDQIFERDEVRSVFSNIHTYTPEEIVESMHDEIFVPSFVTNETALRRYYYQTETKRKKEEKNFSGNNIDFMKSLCLNLTIKRAENEDLQRAEELTVRTHQLNTTGVTYSYMQLYELMHSNKHSLYVCSLEDKYGSYGTIGVCLVEESSEIWKIKLLLMSCRVISRNAGTALIGALIELSKKANVKLQADFIQNENNRQMYIAYKFIGFNEVYNKNKYSLMELNARNSFQSPSYIRINYLL